MIQNKVCFKGKKKIAKRKNTHKAEETLTIIKVIQPGLSVSVSGPCFVLLFLKR